MIECEGSDHGTSGRLATHAGVANNAGLKAEPDSMLSFNLRAPNNHHIARFFASRKPSKTGPFTVQVLLGMLLRGQTDKPEHFLGTLGNCNFRLSLSATRSSQSESL